MEDLDTTETLNIFVGKLQLKWNTTTAKNPWGGKVGEVGSVTQVPSDRWLGGGHSALLCKAFFLRMVRDWLGNFI